MRQYITTDAQLASVADAIRSKAEIESQLTFPGDFVNGIYQILGNGGDPDIRFVLRNVGGSYENSYVTNLGADAFCRMPVTFVSLPNCETVGAGAFTECSYLSGYYIPSCTDLDIGAFAQCTELTSASFLLCQYIGFSAFWGCSKLESVSFPVCSYIGSSAFKDCASLTRASFPSCTTLGNDAFLNC